MEQEQAKLEEAKFKAKDVKKLTPGAPINFNDLLLLLP